MVERVAQHRHCKNCEKAIPYKDEYCDKKCEDDHKTRLRVKKKQLMYFYILTVVLFVLAVSLTLLG